MFSKAAQGYILPQLFVYNYIIYILNPTRNIVVQDQDTHYN